MTAAVSDTSGDSVCRYIQISTRPRCRAADAAPRRHNLCIEWTCGNEAHRRLAGTMSVILRRFQGKELE